MCIVLIMVSLLEQEEAVTKISQKAPMLEWRIVKLSKSHLVLLMSMVLDSRAARRKEIAAIPISRPGRLS